MKLRFDSAAWEDYLWWQAADRETLKRVNRLIEDALRSPGDGIGKPERLKYGASNTWSRRITAEHRFVYRVIDDNLVILALRYRYGR